jgi:hypothetical protein
MKRRLFAITVLVVVLLFCSWRTVGAASTSEEGMSVSKTFAHSQPFVHPGLLHNRADLAFIKQKVAGGEEPWKTAWDKLRSARIASLDWTVSPVADVVRGAYNDPDIGSSNLSHDSAAAYCHALQWVVTGDRAHAKKAMEIIKAWSSTLKSIQGHDQKLLAGFTGHKFCNAAEILRYTESGWPAEDIEHFKNMLMTVYYPLIKDFFPKANGNWDAAMINTMLCIGVFCDNREIFNRAVNHFLHGESNGAITHYIFLTGQCQESTRDQAHTQLGLGMLAAACEVAWKQGVDLYGAADNRLAVGYEYTAKYNLGYDVPCEGNISAQARGRFQSIYEVICQHYVYEKGLKMPYTKMVIDKIRPEGGGGEHLSWGTLTFYKGPRLSKN